MDVYRDTPSTRDSSLPSDQQTQPSLAWITFYGSPAELSGDFVQSVQRLAFLQGRGDDDRWLAQYVATCFNGNALLWYSELDPEIRASWAMIRLALLRRYPPAVSASLGPTLARNQQPPPLQTQPFETSYAIKVLGEDLSLLGFISFDRISGITTIRKEKEKSLRVRPVRVQSASRVQLHMAVSDDEGLSCLGVDLWPASKGDPNVAPKELVNITITFGQTSGRWFHWNVPTPSSRCRKSAGEFGTMYPVDMATWVLASWGEGQPFHSGPSRSDNPEPEDGRAAAVWSCIKFDTELRLQWLSGNGDGCELGGFVHRKTSDELHFHRIANMAPNKGGPYFEEDRVTFYLEA